MTGIDKAKIWLDPKDDNRFDLKNDHYDIPENTFSYEGKEDYGGR